MNLALGQQISNSTFRCAPSTSADGPLQDYPTLATSRRFVRDSCSFSPPAKEPGSPAASSQRLLSAPIYARSSGSFVVWFGIIEGDVWVTGAAIQDTFRRTWQHPWLRRVIAPAIALGVCALLLAVVHHLSHEINYQDLLHAVRKTRSEE